MLYKCKASHDALLQSYFLCPWKCQMLLTEDQCLGALVHYKHITWAMGGFLDKIDLHTSRAVVVWVKSTQQI